MLLGLAPWGILHAQTDEIQVYDAEIVAPGHFNLTLHNNFTPDGRRTADFAAGAAPNHMLNGVPEWAYGVAPWMEAGLYLPLYSYTAAGNLVFNGFKLRALLVAPDAAHRRFFYGVNFEFSYNATHWDPNRYTQEIRAIVGWHLGPFDIVVNPILDNSYKGISELDFAPATRIAYNINEIWAVATEEYDDFGALRRFYPTGKQPHQLFWVVDYKGPKTSIEGGIGIGLTGAADKAVLKLILSRDLN